MKTQEFSSNTAGWRPSRQEVSEFLNEQDLCVISTIDEKGAPQGASVAFSETASGSFIIGTDQHSRKAQNIEGDPRVAMTITDAEQRYTIQLEGEARILSSEEFAELEEEHYRQLPASRPFRDQPGQVHILITPHHLRFSDCNPHPWVLTEFDG